MKILRKSLHVVIADLRAYLFINGLVYGVCLVGFTSALIFPDLTAARIESLENNGTADLVTSLLSNPWLFAAVILGVNTWTIGVRSIVLPSLIVPFAGIAIFAYRSFIIGQTLAPTSASAWVTLIPHTLTWLIELQAYALLVLGVFLLAKSWLRPRSVGAPNRRRGYLHGLRRLGILAVPAFGLLVIGAIYEAFSLIYLVGPLTDLLLGS